MPKPPQRSGNMPAEASSFVGRRRELAEARKRLADARLVSLIGPGGVGKTRLAVRVGADLGRTLPGGAWLVELADIRDPGLVGNAVMAALDLRDQSAAEPAVLLRSYLRDKELLLVVDNCEHVLDAAARLIDDLLRAAPGLRVLATSREPLSVAGEQVLSVPPLDVSSPNGEAVRLFTERAAAATGTFELTDANRAAVVEVCRRLDGLPLAIELAAVRTRALSPEQIADRLSDRFGLLTGGSRAAQPRHQTLRTAIEWSYDLLAPAERTLLTDLGVFAGRFTLDDVEAVCGSDGVPELDLLSSLLDKSLLVRDDAAGIACYRLHETMREYARLSGTEALELRCADYYLSRCQQFAATGRTQLRPSLAWLSLEIDNIRAVLRGRLDRGDFARAAGIATALIWYWITRATTEGARWLDEVLAGPVAHPWTWFARGFLGVLQNDPVAAARALERGVATARETGPVSALSQSLAMASIAATMTGDVASAARLLDEARSTADDLGATLMTYQARALNALALGDLDVVRAAAAEGVRLSREAGDLYSLGMMLMNQGYAALGSGDAASAAEPLAEGLRIAREIDDRVAQCYLVGALGCCAAAVGEPRRAAELLGAMENLRTEIGAAPHPSMAPALVEATRSVTATLGPAAFGAAQDAGRRLTREDSVRLALRETATPPAHAEPHPGGLSRREADVARLTTDGLSNKEIGRRLFISERTVESHVRNILTKLGLTTRTQVATWMATHPDR